MGRIKAFSGQAPWYTPVKETTLTGKYKARLVSGDMEWDLTEGWHPKRKLGWISKGKKSGNVEVTTRTAPDGKKIKIYKTKGYDDYIGFHSHDEPDVDALAFAENAFDENDPSHGRIIKEEGCGHISMIEYAQAAQILRVTFRSNGAVCIFFRVPTAVAGHLIHLAQSKSTRISSVDGKVRHDLGMVFWDEVRIRGQKHGARYPFEYQKRGDYKLTGSNKRYKVTLSDENIKKVLGNKYFGRMLSPGETVSAILSEEEYAKLHDEIHEQARAAVRSTTHMSKDGDEVDIERDGVAGNYYDNHAVDDGKDLLTMLGAKDYARYMELHNRMARANNAAQAKAEAEQQVKSVDMSEAAKKSLWSKYVADVKENIDEYKAKFRRLKYQQNTGHTTSFRDFLYDETTAMYEKALLSMSTKTISDDMLDKRYKNAHIKASKSAARVSLTPHNVFAEDKTALNDYLRLSSLIRKKEKPQKYASTYVGRAWTIDELKDFGNPSMPGAISLEHSNMYKRLLSSGDYEAALNFLKNHKHDIHSNNKVIARRPYATQYDYIVQDK